MTRVKVEVVSLLIALVGIGCGSVSSVDNADGDAAPPADANANVDTRPNTDTTNTADTVVGDGAVAKHSLTVVAAGNGTGTITSAAGIDCGVDCTVTVDEGGVVLLRATADSGSTFAGWTGVDCPGTSTCQVTVTSDVTVQAVFALENSVVVSLVGLGKGTVASTPAGITCPTDCSQAYGPGQTVTLTATPATGSNFAGWTGACAGTGTCVVSTNTAVAVTARFALDTVPLTVATIGAGTGTISSNTVNINCGSNCTANVVGGTMVTLAATPTVGSTFTGWSGGGCTGTAPCTVTVTAATTVTASFAQATYPLKVTKTGPGAGTITGPAGFTCVDTCTQTVTHGSMVTLTAIPGAGAVFSGWSGGGCTGTGPCMVTVTGATNVVATFTLQQHTLTVTKGGTGTGTVTGTSINCGITCSATYGYGTNVTLTPTPASGSVFAGWTGACTGTGACTVSMLGTRTVTATFNASTLTCTNQTNAISCTDLTGVQEINLGAITPAACYSGCVTSLGNAGVTKGCWIKASNGNCYCRGGTLNITNDNGYPGGSCSR